MVPDVSQRHEMITRAEASVAQADLPQHSNSSLSPNVKLEGSSDGGDVDVEAAGDGDANAEPAGGLRGHSRPTGGPEPHRGDKRFVVGLTGATFLDSLKEFMATVFPLAFNEPCHNGSTFLAPLGSYQTYDSGPLHLPDVDPLWLPSRLDMGRMLSKLRYFIQDGSNGELPSGGIYWWGDLNSVPVDPTLPNHSLPPDMDKYRHLAFYHTAFAVSCHATSPAGHMAPAECEAYLCRARKLLGNPLDITRYTISDVAVLALMGYYMIEMNRRDAAYMYVSVAMHISIMHGAHRGWVDERGKRVFWTLYILDRLVHDSYEIFKTCGLLILTPL